jgi:hypothetical protein
MTLFPIILDQGNQEKGHPKRIPRILALRVAHKTQAPSQAKSPALLPINVHVSGGNSTTTTNYAIANQAPLYDAVFSRIEYP